MSSVALLALLLVGGFYLTIGLNQRNRSLEDYLPASSIGSSKVNTSSEFAASTTATTISLVTVVLAFFELAPWFNGWLYFSVLTTALGMALVWRLSGRIWDRLNRFGPHKPSLHEFVAIEYGEVGARKIMALLVAFGFMGAFAVELTVGTRFLVTLMPGAPPFLSAALLASVAVAYTYFGGFRAVVVTDRYQMISIWLMILSIMAYLFWKLVFFEDPLSLKSSAGGLLKFQRPPGLIAFLLGLVLINVPTYLSDMSVWQRIAGTTSREVVVTGFKKSIFATSGSWFALIAIAILTAGLIPANASQTNPLFSLLTELQGAGWPGTVIIFLVSIGLFGAMWSTSSTQLIAAAHAIRIDVMASRLDALGQSPSGIAGGLQNTKALVVILGISAIAIVELFNFAGFTIVDLVFAIFGAQLAIFPVVFLALFAGEPVKRRVARAIPPALLLGFAAGWSCAFVGKALSNATVIFLSPTAALTVSASVLLVCYFYDKRTFHTPPSTEG